MKKTKPTTGTLTDEHSAERRNFIKSAAITTGVAAGITSTTAAAMTRPESDRAFNENKIQRAEAHKDFKNSPIHEFQFPATGADIFAKACKDEGLAALFCCPGNYSVVSALGNAGIPTYGGVLGIFRPKTTKNAVAPAIRSLPNGITFSEVHIYTDFG